jgi:lipopolysaccharide transport system permease protein
MSHYVDVISVLAWKDFKVRYRSSALGFVWSILNPLAYMIILTLVFSVLIRTNIVNYPAWFLVGILIWRFFSVATTQGLYSIVSNASLVSKVYIPRYLIVLSNCLGNLLGASLEFVVLLPLLVLLGVNFSLFAFFFPIVITLEFLLIFGLSLSLSSLVVRYRDLYQIWDIVLQLGFFLSPIVYDVTSVPTRFRMLYELNPATRLIVTARMLLLQHAAPDVLFDLTTLSIIGVTLLIGFIVFGSLEKRFVDQL